MEAVTTIRKMLGGGKIFVPIYQRAYSWDIDTKDSPPKQISTFIKDLEMHHSCQDNAPYYFGHFLFEDNEKSNYAVIDGQQRLTTIVIYLSALFRCLEELRELTEEEKECREDIIKRGSRYRFETTDYDGSVLKDYVIDRVKTAIIPETTSSKRIIDAYDYFYKTLKHKTEECLVETLDSVANATCTTHIVSSESEAIQMFLFQNNRGKKPSLLEIVKAELMSAVHFFASKDDIPEIITEIKNRFEKIYKSISKIEYNIDEDEVLLYTLRVYFNSLWIERIDIIDKLEYELYTKWVEFAKEFALYLEDSFTNLVEFFTHDKDNYEIASLMALSDIGLAIPFIIKAYKYNLDLSEKCALAKELESLILRHRLIGTRADLKSRLNHEYQEFTDKKNDIQPIINIIKQLKTVDSDNWWWAHWNNEALRNSLQGEINQNVAKYLLWKYENYLIKNSKHNGYKFRRYDDIEAPELEHIAPQTKNEEIASGYCDYDEEFKELYLNCLGNYLLISKSHNCSIGNVPFQEKRSTYTHLEQQREIQQITETKEKWTKELIKQRKEKIVNFIIDTF